MFGTSFFLCQKNAQNITKTPFFLLFISFFALNNISFTVIFNKNIIIKNNSSIYLQITLKPYLHKYAGVVFVYKLHR